MVKFHNCPVLWVLRTRMRKLYGEVLWEEIGAHRLSYLCWVQTKSVAELQVKSRLRGSPFAAVTILAFSFQGFSMESLGRLINLTSYRCAAFLVIVLARHQVLMDSLILWSAAMWMQVDIHGPSHRNWGESKKTVPGMLHTRMGRGKREKIIFSYSFVFSPQSVVDLEQRGGHFLLIPELETAWVWCRPQTCFFLHCFVTDSHIL